MAAMTKWMVPTCVLILAFCAYHVQSSADIMKKLTTQFATALDTCKNELSLPEAVMQDFYNFWREEYALVNRELGCALICMASKLDLVTEDWSVHHEKAHHFAKTHGADDGMAKQLVTILHECEKQFAGISDDCIRTLEIAKCFRTKIHGLKWAPSMEEVLQEVLTEV